MENAGRVAIVLVVALIAGCNKKDEEVQRLLAVSKKLEEQEEKQRREAERRKRRSRKVMRRLERVVGKDAIDMYARLDPLEEQAATRYDVGKVVIFDTGKKALSDASGYLPDDLLPKAKGEVKTVVLMWPVEDSGAYLNGEVLVVKGYKLDFVDIRTKEVFHKYAFPLDLPESISRFQWGGREDGPTVEGPPSAEEVAAYVELVARELTRGPRAPKALDVPMCDSYAKLAWNCSDRDLRKREYVEMKRYFDKLKERSRAEELPNPLDPDDPKRFQRWLKSERATAASVCAKRLEKIKKACR